MQFELFPTIDIMVEFYRKPASMERFREYIKLLQGDTKDDLVFPIAGFNPMAKGNVLQCLEALKALSAEVIMAECIKKINHLNVGHNINTPVKVALNLLDDLKGGWTNRYTTEYDSKFKLPALVKRNFCTPVFWSSETYSEQLIVERTQEYMLRTIYQSTHSRPLTLCEHIAQEQYVAKYIGKKSEQSEESAQLRDFYELNKGSDDYAVIFNFLYGDTICNTLGFPVYGIPGEMPGYKYATEL